MLTKVHEKNFVYVITRFLDFDIPPYLIAEIEKILGKFCLPVKFDMEKIKEIQEYGPFYPATDIPMYQTIIVSYYSLLLMINLIQKLIF